MIYFLFFFEFIVCVFGLRERVGVYGVGREERNTERVAGRTTKAFFFSIYCLLRFL